MSSRGADSYTLAVGHKEGAHFVIDLVRGTGGKFDPDIVTQEYAALLREYRAFQVTGDSYAGQWVAGAWRKAGIGYFKSELPKSQIYLECLPLFARGLVRLPNHPRHARVAAIGAPHPSLRQGYRGSRPQRSR
jgi:hypothetical protein